MLTYGLIPARSGSKGLPNKNVALVNKIPLLAYSIAASRQIGLDRTIVSTDSSHYAQIATSFGGEVPFLRNPLAATDTAMEEDILLDLDVQLPKYGIEVPDIWVWLKPTSPFRDLGSVIAAIDLLKRNPDIDSVRIVSEADARLHIINADGWLEPMTGSWDPTRSKMRRSEFPTVYKPFNLEVFRHRKWQELGSGFMGNRIRAIVAPQITGLDIDDQESFEIVQALIESKPSPPVIEKHLVRPTQDISK